jgi:hypothetical protein
LALLRQRMARCGEMHRRHHTPRPVNYQAGECDIGICDIGACDFHHGAVDAAGDACGSCGGCDWPQRSRKDPEPAEPRS